MATEIASFLITFRESLEAALVMSIIAAYLAKIGKRRLNKYLWLGSGVAMLASLALGVSIWLIYGTLAGTVKELFEGGAALMATVVLTSMIVWMARNARKIKGELQQKIDIAITTGQLLGIAILAFIVVFREGLETVLFLTALMTLDLGGTMLGAIGGCAVVVGLAVLMWKESYKLDIRSFFKVTSIILVVFAAGLTAYGIHELNEAGIIPPVIEHVWDINPPKNPDGSYPLLHEEGVVGSILKGLMGYNGNPSLTEVIGYSIYWLLIGTYLLKVYAPTNLLNLFKFRGTDMSRED